MDGNTTNHAMELETDRKSSFPSSIPDEIAISFSVAGFSYVNGDYPIMVVSCVVCQLQFECNSTQINPLAEHFRRNSSCSYLRSITSYTPGELPPPNGSSHDSDTGSDDDIEDLIADLGTRLLTYEDENWLVDCPVDKEDLAAAGFYFAGRGDNVRCFSCGSVVHDWEAGDSPLDEHRRLVPDCRFLNSLVTGDQFVLVNDAKELVDDPHEHSCCMHSERHRLVTFAAYPDEAAATVPPSALARAGFYYTGIGDVVRCAFCRLTHRRFQRGDFAHRTHRLRSPFCTLVRGTCTMNVPLDGDLVKPGMEDEETRFRSFAEWPRQLGVSVGELALSGFYYSGTGDRATCYSCLNTLRDWSPEQSATSRHRVVSPACPHAGGTDRRNVPARVPSLDCTAVYRVEKTRRQSFANWPPQASMDCDSLAEAGLFYAGVCDVVQCPFCCVQIRNWRKGQSPLAMHKQLSTSCEFLRRHQALYGSTASADSQDSPSRVSSERRPDVTRSVHPSCRSSGTNILRMQPSYASSSNIPDFSGAQVTQTLGPSHARSGANAHLDVGVVGDQRLLMCASSCPTRPSVGIHETLPSPVVIPADTSRDDAVPPPAGRLNRSVSCMPTPGPRDEKEFELEELKALHCCVVCQDRDATQFFMPCGHLVCCLHCSKSLTKCPMCQGGIVSSLRAYFPWQR